MTKLLFTSALAIWISAYKFDGMSLVPFQPTLTFAGHVGAYPTFIVQTPTEVWAPGGVFTTFNIFHSLQM
jgi:hypothetical protein